MDGEGLTFLIRRMWKHKSWETGIVAIIASKVLVNCKSSLLEYDTVSK
jgi:hypothetical protein